MNNNLKVYFFEEVEYCKKEDVDTLLIKIADKRLKDIIIGIDKAVESGDVGESKAVSNLSPHKNQEEHNVFEVCINVPCPYFADDLKYKCSLDITGTCQNKHKDYSNLPE